ncbi:hypothetical protein QMO43_20040 [Pseudomonas aeruginosa]|uniref:hypothetical protein n=1 Tax=Pseudomonas aeruginosa TaxID=287 RepID=UPI000FC431CC|nr:hypothetical protein [Pseudomonas aeruginosa]MBI8037298.1 hypothetical protein [Pseudomonas aeruginosa]MCT4980448.1 hypothetical protein [Pseudomonas aeruginosa]MDI7142827.1 hypothetical protein [Pseudomonas aeruginosa]RUE15613.1 hypothetical protein IPC1232_29315 [Pseudomonas aeruginosa]HBO4991752.1 hypothetical protein [Pseudomonas aeruginosa]
MIDFEKRLSSMKERRQGSRERAILEAMTFDHALEAIAANTEIRKSESFEQIKEPAGVKYAIGAMAAVEEKYTEVSLREGNRVADSLIKSLEGRGIYATKRLQGSVALDIHIRGYSDVDMLVIENSTILIESPRVEPNTYLPASDKRGMKEIIKDLREQSITTLNTNFPQANIAAGGKSICLSGGSLKRKVDIVPACWYDSIKYQNSQQEKDRGIKIYNKTSDELFLNYPFTHIANVNQKDTLYSGNLKCVIRLMKNIIADMPDYKKKIATNLTSYDLAAIAYHMDNNLIAPSYMRLSLVEKLRSHLTTLVAVEGYREALLVPDGTRKIFDKEEKFTALAMLYSEVDELAKEIAREINPLEALYKPETLNKYIF